MLMVYVILYISVGIWYMINMMMMEMSIIVMLFLCDCLMFMFFCWICDCCIVRIRKMLSIVSDVKGIMNIIKR